MRFAGSLLYEGIASSFLEAWEGEARGPSPGNNLEAGDSLKVTKVNSEHRVSLLDAGGRDQQIVKRQGVSFRRFLAFELACQPCGLFSRWMDRNKVDQFFDVFTTTVGGSRRLRTINPMHPFGDRHRR